MLRCSCFVLLVAGALVSCGKPAPDTTSASRIASLEAELARRDLRIAELEKMVESAIPKDVRDEADRIEKQVLRSKEPASARSAAPMCYKDYCPCEGPQGGPDSVLCDQLEAGIAPDIQLMIAGRGMREARRQIETGDY